MRSFAPKKIKMKSKHIRVFTILATTLAFASCDSSTMENNSPAKSEEKQVSMVKHAHVMTKAEQDSLSPDQVLQDFLAGNARFNSGNLTQREHSEEIRKAATGGQFPKAMVLSCLDSRVPVEDVFDQGIGDCFVGRVAGNFVNTDLLGSMEFACKVAGAKLIIVMGHQHCGAIKGAIDDVKMGNLTAMLANIKPAVEMSKTFEGERTSKNEAFVKCVAENNIRNTIAQIRTKSEILRELEAKGQVKIVGVFYTLRNGTLEIIN